MLKVLDLALYLKDFETMQEGKHYNECFGTQAGSGPLLSLGGFGMLLACHYLILVISSATYRR